MMEAMMSVADFKKHRIAGAVDFAETRDGLVKAVVLHRGISGELVLQGAQVTAWAPPGARPVIFISPRAVFTPGKAIRGGIPVIFPWFGPHPSDPTKPQHGTARTTPWTLDRVSLTDPHPNPPPLAGEGVASASGTSPSPASGGGSGWGAGVTFELSLATSGFDVAYRVVFGTELQLSLAARNTTAEPATFEEALHTYFAVSDVERVRIAGLETSGSIDKTANMSRPPAGAALALTKETDSVYLGVPDRLTIADPDWGRRIVIVKTGAASAIVWNPWPEKAAAMGDLGAENWRGFVCVETGNVADNCVTIAPGATHTMTTRISLDGG
jgi:glucose-6-phosphate 1-epimerase